MAPAYQRGDVLLVTLTYSSQMGVKKRPVIVLRERGRCGDRNAVEAKLTMVFREIVPF